MGQHRTQQVCRDGHQITSSLEGSPELSAPFCGECGKPTMHTCDHCGAGIRGYYHVEDYFGISETPVPLYCHACGKPYPWRQAALAAAMEMADELDELPEADRQKLKEALSDIARDGPRTELGVTRIKKLAARLGGAGARVIQRIATEIATDKAKELLGGLLPF